MRQRATTLLTLCGAALLAHASAVHAQALPTIAPERNHYYPLNLNNAPPGTAGLWAIRRGHASMCFQPVRVDLPGGGHVTWFNGGPERPIKTSTDTPMGLLVGAVYRFRIGQMPEYPGVELYPSVEVIDRLHPPAGKSAAYPVPIPFTPLEIEQAVSGQLVTKVIFLEQPNRAAPVAASPIGAIPTRVVGTQQNPLEVADVYGRPLLIVRLGGRLPDPGNEPRAFYGSCAPVLPMAAPKPVRPRPAAPAPAIEQPAVEEPAVEEPATEEPRPEEN